jgi:hypothetical protein
VTPALVQRQSSHNIYLSSGTRYRTLKHERGTLIGLCGFGAAMLDRFRNRGFGLVEKPTTELDWLLPRGHAVAIDQEEKDCGAL